MTTRIDFYARHVFVGAAKTEASDFGGRGASGLENPSMSEIGGIAVAELVKSSFKAISEGVIGKASKLYTSIFEDFEPYMLKCYQKNRFVRILCQGDDDVDILEIYVPTLFLCSDQHIRDDEMISEIGCGGNYIVTGNGGAGKTFFMRKLWLDLFKERQRTPLFIELRKLNELSKFDLEAFIRASVSQNITSDVFEDLCSQGRFVFILDGFDELPAEKYDEIQEEILGMAEKYPACSIVTSSRPDGRFTGWATFKKVEAAPFILSQTKELCSKIPFEEEFKKKFQKILTPEFFKKHESFLSNPLLSIMMMMTFRRNMDVPTKMGIFYDEAFNTLYQWHDATKAFKRKKNLDILQFRRSFGVFCLLSYTKEKFNFSQTEIEEIIEKSRELVRLDAETECILSDYERNVNLIMQDGHRYYFIHRSFQEYFAAWALVNVFPHKFSEFAKIIETRGADTVIKICYDLQRSLVVNEYLKPRYDDFNEAIRFGGRLNSERIWGDYIQGIRFHFFRSVKEADPSTGTYGFGVSLNIEPRFENFFRNILKINKDGTEDEAQFVLSTSIVEHGVFDSALRWIQETDLSNVEHSVLDASVDLRSGTARIFSPEVEGREREEIASIDLLPRDLEMLEKSAKDIGSVISKEARWCKSEISSIRETDDEIDKLFL